ncbi:MAG: hypothetical protein AB1439_10775 [candidate division FCPU426 bacterium]
MATASDKRKPKKTAAQGSKAATRARQAKSQAAIPAPVAASAPAAPPRAAKPGLPHGIILGVLLALVVLVSVEVVILMKDKADRKRILRVVEVVPERGGPPDMPGKFWGPYQVKVNEQAGRLALVDHAFNKVVLWDLATKKHVVDVNAALLGREQFVPKDVDVADDGDYYILDHSDMTVKRFSAQNQLVQQWKIPESVSLTAGKDRDVYVLDGRAQEIVHYQNDGTELGRFGKGKLKNGLLMDTDEAGNIYVVDSGYNGMVVFSKAGKHLYSWPIKEVKPLQMSRMAAVNNQVYFYDLVNNNGIIRVYTPKGRLAWDIGPQRTESFDVGRSGTVYMSGNDGIVIQQIEK